MQETTDRELLLVQLWSYTLGDDESEEAFQRHDGIPGKGSAKVCILKKIKKGEILQHNLAWVQTHC